MRIFLFYKALSMVAFVIFNFFTGLSVFKFGNPHDYLKIKIAHKYFHLKFLRNSSVLREAERTREKDNLFIFQSFPKILRYPKRQTRLNFRFNKYTYKKKSINLYFYERGFRYKLKFSALF